MTVDAPADAELARRGEQFAGRHRAARDELAQRLGDGRPSFAVAPGRARDEASKVLTQWLAQESKREGVDAVGNVSNLVEALGNVGGGDAALALAGALDGGGLPLHVQILAVQKLGELADPRTRPSVERFAARAAALPKAEDLEEELRMEAINTARETLARL